MRHRRLKLFRIQICFSYFLFALLNVCAIRLVNADSNVPATPLLSELVAQAKQSAKETYQAPASIDMDSMSYQDYRAIRFKTQHSLWRDKHETEVQFFHSGFLYQRPVKIFVVDKEGKVAAHNFSSEQFSYSSTLKNTSVAEYASQGYAGFRLHYPINSVGYKDEYAVFLGASYFRLVGQDQNYGLSARGLAIDTGLSTGEEFPFFTHFWLHTPELGLPLVIYARLSSASVEGVYRFVMRPGSHSFVDVDAWLFARKDVKKLGLAPLTSMYLYGENTQLPPDDFRPEVHDSDGVVMTTRSGERIWRPLTNPQSLQITTLSDRQPQGFGLLQRDGDFTSYLDTEANYHKRPGLWVDTLTGFEQGHVEVVEIPSDSETNDNIVVYWVNTAPFKKGEQRYVKYRLQTMRNDLSVSDLSVERTRHGSSALPGDASDGSRRFIVDFRVPKHCDLTQMTLSPEASVIGGEISELQLFVIEGGRYLRVTFVLSNKGNNTADMRLVINDRGVPVSEVWNYVYQ